MNSQASLIRLIATITGIALLFVGCAPAPTATPTPQPTATEVPTATSLPATAAPPPTERPQTPTAALMLLSKHPELMLATNRPPKKTDLPQHVVYSLPNMDRVFLASELPFYDNLLVDIYYPPEYQFNTKLPVVIHAHGFSDSGGQTITDKDFQYQIDWGELFAVSGMIAVSAQAGPDPYLTLNQLLNYLNANADQLGIDMTRIGFWGVSSQVWPASRAFADSPYRDSFRAAAFLSPDLSIIPKSWPGNLSLFVARGEKDQNIPAPVVERYVASARANNIPVDYIVVPDAVHGFDIYQDMQASKDAVQQALEFFKSKLLTAK